MKCLECNDDALAGSNYCGAHQPASNRYTRLERRDDAGYAEDNDDRNEGSKDDNGDPKDE